MMASTACSTTLSSTTTSIFDLGQEIDHVFGAAIELGMALLATEALHFGDRQARDADLGEGFTHLVQLERFDDGGHLFHGNSSLDVS